MNKQALYQCLETKLTSVQAVKLFSVSTSISYSIELYISAKYNNGVITFADLVLMDNAAQNDDTHFGFCKYASVSSGYSLKLYTRTVDNVKTYYMLIWTTGATTSPVELSDLSIRKEIKYGSFADLLSASFDLSTLLSSCSNIDSFTGESANLLHNGALQVSSLHVLNDMSSSGSVGFGSSIYATQNSTTGSEINIGYATLPENKYNFHNAYFTGGVSAASFTGTSFNGALYGNADTATKLQSSKNITLKDADGTNSATAVGFDGSADIILKLPSTIKASLSGNATSATSATNVALTASTTETSTANGDVYTIVAGNSVGAAFRVINAKHANVAVYDDSENLENSPIKISEKFVTKNLLYTDTTSYAGISNTHTNTFSDNAIEMFSAVVVSGGSTYTNSIALNVGNGSGNYAANSSTSPSVKISTGSDYAKFEPTSLYYSTGSTTGSVAYNTICTTGGFTMAGNISIPDMCQISMVDGGVLNLGSSGYILSTSDARLKNKNKIIDSDWITKLVDKIDVYDYSYKGSDAVNIGVMAQDLESLLPERYRDIFIKKQDLSDQGGLKDQYAINKTDLIFIVLEELKTQQKRIRELESELAKLKN